MAIQWFPGHMHLTRKAIGERIKDIDVVMANQSDLTEILHTLKQVVCVKG